MKGTDPAASGAGKGSRRRKRGGRPRRGPGSGPPSAGDGQQLEAALPQRGRQASRGHGDDAGSAGRDDHGSGRGAVEQDAKGSARRGRRSRGRPRKKGEERGITEDPSRLRGPPHGRGGGEPEQAPHGGGNAEKGPLGDAEGGGEEDKARGGRPRMRRSDKFVLLRKTELCRHYMAGYCPRPAGECAYAHGYEDLRTLSIEEKAKLRLVPSARKWRTKPCLNYITTGFCRFGERCTFIHDHEAALDAFQERGEEPPESLVAAAKAARAKGGAQRLTGGSDPDPGHLPTNAETRVPAAPPGNGPADGDRDGSGHLPSTASESPQPHVASHREVKGRRDISLVEGIGLDPTFKWSRARVRTDHRRVDGGTDDSSALASSVAQGASSLLAQLGVTPRPDRDIVTNSNSLAPTGDSEPDLESTVSDALDALESGSVLGCGEALVRTHTSDMSSALGHGLSRHASGAANALQRGLTKTTSFCAAAHGGGAGGGGGSGSNGNGVGGGAVVRTQSATALTDLARARAADAAGEQDENGSGTFLQSMRVAHPRVSRHRLAQLLIPAPRASTLRDFFEESELRKLDDFQRAQRAEVSRRAGTIRSWQHRLEQGVEKEEGEVEEVEEVEEEEEARASPGADLASLAGDSAVMAPASEHSSGTAPAGTRRVSAGRDTRSQPLPDVVEGVEPAQGERGPSQGPHASGPLPRTPAVMELGHSDEPAGTTLLPAAPMPFIARSRRVAGGEKSQSGAAAAAADTRSPLSATLGALGVYTPLCIPATGSGELSVSSADSGGWRDSGGRRDSGGAARVDTSSTAGAAAAAAGPMHTADLLLAREEEVDEAEEGALAAQASAEAGTHAGSDCDVVRQVAPLMELDSVEEGAAAWEQLAEAVLEVTVRVRSSESRCRLLKRARQAAQSEVKELMQAKARAKGDRALKEGMERHTVRAATRQLKLQQALQRRLQRQVLMRVVLSRLRGAMQRVRDAGAVTADRVAGADQRITSGVERAASAIAAQESEVGTALGAAETSSVGGRSSDAGSTGAKLRSRAHSASTADGAASWSSVPEVGGGRRSLRQSRSGSSHHSESQGGGREEEEEGEEKAGTVSIQAQRRRAVRAATGQPQPQPRPQPQPPLSQQPRAPAIAAAAPAASAARLTADDSVFVSVPWGRTGRLPAQAQDTAPSAAPAAGPAPGQAARGVGLDQRPPGLQQRPVHPRPQTAELPFMQPPQQQPPQQQQQQQQQQQWAWQYLPVGLSAPGPAPMQQPVAVAASRRMGSRVPPRFRHVTTPAVAGPGPVLPGAGTLSAGPHAGWAHSTLRPNAPAVPPPPPGHAATAPPNGAHRHGSMPAMWPGGQQYPPQEHGASAHWGTHAPPVQPQPHLQPQPQQPQQPQPQLQPPLQPWQAGVAPHPRSHRASLQAALARGQAPAPSSAEWRDPATGWPQAAARSASAATWSPAGIQSFLEPGRATGRRGGDARGAVLPRHHSESASSLASAPGTQAPVWPQARATGAYPTLKQNTLPPQGRLDAFSAALEDWVAWDAALQSMATGAGGAAVPASAPDKPPSGAVHAAAAVDPVFGAFAGPLGGGGSNGAGESEAGFWGPGVRPPPSR